MPVYKVEFTNESVPDLYVDAPIEEHDYLISVLVNNLSFGGSPEKCEISSIESSAENPKFVFIQEIKEEETYSKNDFLNKNIFPCSVNFFGDGKIQTTTYLFAVM